MQATELVIKNKVHWQFRQMYQKEVFKGICKNNGPGENILYFIHQVLVNQDLQKIDRRSVTQQSINSIYTAQRQKMERHMISWFRVIKGTECEQSLMTSMQHHWIPGVLKRIWQGQHHKDFFTIHKQGMGSTLKIITKASKIRNCWESSVNHQNMRISKEVKKCC